MKNIYTIILLLLVSFSLYAGPFGLEIGMSIEQVTLACNGIKPEMVEEDVFIINPIKNHPDFETYVAWISKTEGLYYLKAVSSDIETIRYGTGLKSKFDSIEHSITKTYGIPSRVDEIHPKSIWHAPNNWMYALSQGDRNLYSFWLKDNESSLPNSINCIGLTAKATSSTCGYIVLEYDFINRQKVEEQNNSVF